MPDRRCRLAVALILAVALGAGCASDAPPAAPGVTARQTQDVLLPDPDGNVGRQQLIAGYRLPAASIPPTRHADPAVAAQIDRMAALAASQGLTFDGSRAAQGIVLVGKPGQGAPIVLAIAVYAKTGGLAIRDTLSTNGLDARAGARLRDRFLDRL